MTLTIALITVGTAAVIALLAQDVRHYIASTQHAGSPLQRTERSLANRFARGEITARDYERVLRLLRD